MLIQKHASNRKLAVSRMILIIFPLLLHLASSDILHVHLTNNVNVDVKPCDDFFLHVCSQSVNDAEFPLAKIEEFYEEFAKKFRRFSESRNLAITNDYTKLVETDNDAPHLFNRSEFENLLRMRCEDSDACYREEFEYFVYFYMDKTDQPTDHLKYFISKLSTIKGEEILQVLPNMVESTYNTIYANFSNATKTAQRAQHFYAALTNRLFVMEELKEDGIFEQIVDMREDVAEFKALIIEKFRNTPWMTAKDNLGLSLLSEFEDTINNLVVYYDLDESDRDLELLREINSKFAQDYYQMQLRSTGAEALDIIFSLENAYTSMHNSPNPEEVLLVNRVEYALQRNAYYWGDSNNVAMLAPYVYPQFTNNVTFNKNYFTFAVIGHEIFHSVVLEKWAERSDAFKNGMDCLHEHYNRTCDSYGEGVCNSGALTFGEDGADLEGLRINYEFLIQNNRRKALKGIVFESEFLSVNREQAFFYLFAINYCGTITTWEEHTDEHSPNQVRVNGVVTQMPEFTKVFSCSPDQAMFAKKEHICNLFGPDSQ